MATTKAEIEGSIHGGILDANRRYANWSNGYLVKDFGVEGVIVACVAASVHKKQTEKESLWIEVPFGDIISMARTEGHVRGRPPELLANQNRADIVLFNARDQPTTVIELKRFWSRQPCIVDLERIGGLVERYNHANGGTLRRGFLGLSVAKQRNRTKSADERMEDQVNKIRKALDEDFQTGCNVRVTNGKPRKHGDWKVCSVVVEVAAKMDGTG